MIVNRRPKLLGFSINSTGPVSSVAAIATAVFDGRRNLAAFAVGATSRLVILLLKGRPRVPGLLVAVLGATAVVVLGRLGGAWQATRRRTCGA